MRCVDGGDDIVCHYDGLGDMVADVVASDELVDSRVFERFLYVGFDAREDDVDSFALR